MIDLEDNPLKIGGLGCTHCRHWQKLAEDNAVKKQLGITDGWGFCYNKYVKETALQVLSTEDAYAKEKVYIGKTKVLPGVEVLVVATSPSYVCLSFGMKKEDQK